MLKRRAKEFLGAWLPPALNEGLLRCVSRIRFLRSPYRKLLRPNATLKDVGRGRRCFLLATGPSLKLEDLSKLQGEDCFSISNFFLHPDLTKIAPKIHFFAPFHPPLILENYVEWLRKAHAALPPETEIGLGHMTEEMVRRYDLFRGRKIYYLYLAERPSLSEVDLLAPILAPQTGPLLILPALIYMGYETIYLLGCDHTEFRTYGEGITHFYKPDADPRVNSSDKNAWEGIMHSLEGTLRVFQQYRRYQDHLAKTGRTRIVNLSKDSWLDFFEKDELSRVLK